MARQLGDAVVREVPLLREDEPVAEALEKILQAGLPALPVTGDDGQFTGIFGEREFIGAIYPGYLGELSYAGFVSERLEETLEKRRTCLREPVSAYMNKEHIDVSGDYSDAQVAETFLHHRVLIVPVTDEGRVTGVITRSDFFEMLVKQATGNQS